VEIGQGTDKDKLQALDVKAGIVGALDSLSRVICPLSARRLECCTGTGHQEPSPIVFYQLSLSVPGNPFSVSVFMICA
jgi:hypothetical protein